MSDKDEHIIEAIGRARVVVRDGKVIEVGESMIEACPLARRFACPVDHATPDAVKANIEERIRSYGMCTQHRELLLEGDFVLFGASELISNGIQAGLIDAAVIVCDGAGTIIVPNPSLVQGIGGRMSGLISTSPIPEVISRIEQHGGKVVFQKNALIDQVQGVDSAHSDGFRRIAVTVAKPEDAEEIRRAYPETMIIGVHLTGLNATEAERMMDTCDIVSSCASKYIREHAGARAILQAGVSIPVFALTAPGKDLILEKIRVSKVTVVIRSANLPYLDEKSPYPLI